MKIKNVLLCLTGAFLMGFLWRVRGTGGWGAAWGLLNAGFVFTLFLTAAMRHKKGPSLRLIALASFSFMLTAPAWGTLLNQITGVLGGLPEGADPVYISPFTGVLLMALMGFGLAAVFGVLLGRCFSDKPWRLRDYLVLLAVFLVVMYGAKASVAHPVVKLIQPEAAGQFQAGLTAAGIDKTPFGAYLAHFNAEGWAKKIDGGRHYYACVSAVSSALAAAACILTARFFVKDRIAARIGAVVCGAFAFSITLADLFFFFANGGYHGEQGFSLPANFAAWSLWEYFTGFIAGGIITALALRFAPREDTKETLLAKLSPKPLGALTFILCCVGAIGLNIVRPILRRMKDSPYLIPAVIVAAVLAVAFCLVLCRKFGFSFERADAHRFPAMLCFTLVAYIFIVYMFVGAPEIGNLHAVHNVLVAVSFAVCEAAAVRLSI
jgi:hypothetical protein